MDIFSKYQFFDIVAVVEHKNVCCVNVPIYLWGNILLKRADLFFVNLLQSILVDKH